MFVIKNMNRFMRLKILLIIVFSVSLTVSCGKKPVNNQNSINREIAEKADYFDVDYISGSFNASDDIAVTWQKSGLIRSEVKVFMDTVHWASDIPSSETMTNTSDLDGDGKDEMIEIQSGPDTGGMSVLVFMNGKTVNLFGLVSQEFLEAVKQMPGGEDGSGIPIYIDAACIDLNGDDYREILLAVGNDNGALAVSLLKYTGKDLLYNEAGGIKGTTELRYIIITEEKTLFAELFFSNPQTSEELPVNYVEFIYDGAELKLMRDRDLNEDQEYIDEEQNENDYIYSNGSIDEETIRQESFAEYVRIKTWYSGGGFSSETAWVHFKAVDAEGMTVKEVLGSDQVNMRSEQSALAETENRRELVDKLRKEMISEGWKEVGVAEGGEWYEYIFAR